MTNEIEILAPAGSRESLSAAINAGAGSVYFGVDQLNMRAMSRNNFTASDLPEISQICRKHDVRTYLALNTVLFDEDLAVMRSLVDKAVDAGIDAVIVSDPAVMQHARSAGIPVHISTQCNITNIEAVQFYAQWADVMVLARELSLEQVGNIAREIRAKAVTGPSGKPVRLEVFIHGALCMAVSGKCYLSLHSYNTSANRGSCIQNCRRPYEVRDKISGTELEVDNEYIMSAKDLCTIPFLDKVLDAGVQVLKIEGRGRSADYVHTTVTCYRKAIEAIQQEVFTSEKVAEWEKELKTVYNRGFWDGYYLGRKTGEWSDAYGSKATVRKQFLGRCENYYKQVETAVFQIDTGMLKTGDEIMITGPTTGVMKTTADELRVDDRTVNQVGKGDHFTTKVPGKIRRSDKLYKLVQANR